MPAKNVLVLGDGAMATVCALLLVSEGNNVTIWGPFEEHIQQMQQTRRNDKYLGGEPLPDALQLTNDVNAASDAQVVLCAIPTQFVRSVFERFTDTIDPSVPIASVSKGVENGTLLRPTQVIADVLGRSEGTGGPIGVLSGPSIAKELAAQKPATLCAACGDLDFADELQALFSTHWMRVYTNPDVIGVEIAGATKNVIALAAGILDGLHAGYNAKSALLARGLSEIARLGAVMGAHAETFFGITGVGDLATTCFCPEGRNRTCGELLGKGHSLEEAQQMINGVVEGVATTRSVTQLAAQHQVEMPITAAVYHVLFEGLHPNDAITKLMARPPKREIVG